MTPSPSNTPLFPMLLGPLRARRTDPRFPDVYVKEDFTFLSALVRALEDDLEKGVLPLPPDPSWLDILARKMTPPIVQNGLAEFEPIVWPLPGQLWINNPNADPRSYLIARLIHLGVDPLAKIDSSERTVVGTLLVNGYSDIFSLCMDLPRFNQDITHGLCPQSNRSLERPYFQEVVAQDLFEITRLLLQNSPSLDGILFHANSPEMVKMLLDHGANTLPHENSGDTLTGFWLRTKDATLARRMIQSVETLTDPAQRLTDAINGTAWSAIKDAILAFPEWNKLQKPVGKTAVRVHLNALMEASLYQTHQVSHVLRMAALAPFDDREIVPGLTEAAMARLSLGQFLSVLTSKRSTKADDQLKQKIQKKLTEWGHTQQTLIQDAHHFLRYGSALHHTPQSHKIACYLTKSDGPIFPSEKGMLVGERFKRRGWPEFELAAGCAAALNYEHVSGGEDSLKQLLGHGRSPIDIGRIFPGDPRNTWIDRVILENPDKANQIATGCFEMLHLLVSTTMFSGAVDNLDFWGPHVARIENMVSAGAHLDVSPQQAREFARSVKNNSSGSSFKGWPTVIRFSNGLGSLLEKRALQSQTQDAPKASRPTRRF